MTTTELVYRCRWPLAGVYVGAMLLLAWMVLPGRPATLGMSYGQKNLLALCVTGVSVMTPFLLLGMARDWREMLCSDLPAPTLSIVTAGLLAGVLTFGYVSVVLSWWGWWEIFTRETFITGSWGLAITVRHRYWPLWTSILILSVMWTVVFYSRRKPDQRYERLCHYIRGLETAAVGLVMIVIVLGTALNELKGSGGLVAGMIGFGVLTWSLGADLVLVFLTEKHLRRERGLCERCGYDLRGTIEGGRSACPECGEPIRWICAACRHDLRTSLSRRNPTCPGCGLEIERATGGVLY